MLSFFLKTGKYLLIWDFQEIDNFLIFHHSISAEAQGCRYQIFPWVLSLAWYLMQQIFLELMCQISFSTSLKFTSLNSKCAKKIKLYSNNNNTWMVFIFPNNNSTGSGDPTVSEMLLYSLISNLSTTSWKMFLSTSTNFWPSEIWPPFQSK